MNYNEDNLDELTETIEAEAEVIFKDADETEKRLQKIEAKLRKVPLGGSALAYIPLLISVVRSYLHKEYREIPVQSLLAIMLALTYVLSPVDLIPDMIPVIGLTDDAAVIAGCVSLIRNDLADYQKWRREKGYLVEDLPDYASVHMSTKGFAALIRKVFEKVNKA